MLTCPNTQPILDRRHWNSFVFVSVYGWIRFVTHRTSVLTASVHIRVCAFFCSLVKFIRMRLESVWNCNTYPNIMNRIDRSIAHRLIIRVNSQHVLIFQQSQLFRDWFRSNLRSAQHSTAQAHQPAIILNLKSIICKSYLIRMQIDRDLHVNVWKCTRCLRNFRTCNCKLHLRESFTILQKHKYANHSRLENYVTAACLLK